MTDSRKYITAFEPITEGHRFELDPDASITGTTGRAWNWKAGKTSHLEQSIARWTFAYKSGRKLKWRTAMTIPGYDPNLTFTPTKRNWPALSRALG